VVTREAEGGLSYQIIEAMQTGDDSQPDSGQPAIIWIKDKDYDEARRQVENKELSGFLAFPADFTERVFMGEGAQLEVIANAEAPYTRGALNGLANAIASRIGSQYAAMQASIELLREQGQPFSGEAGIPTNGSLIQFETQKVGEVEPEQASNYVLPGYLVMFVFFAAALGAEVIIRERQNHTLERLLASSVRRESILGGVFAGTAAKGLIQIAVFWAVGILVFNIDLGLSPAAVIILSILMVIMSSAFAIMLAAVVRTQRSAASLAVLVSLVLAPLGGCWWPLFITPSWMQFLAKFTPHGWANTGFYKLMLFGAEFGDVVPEMLALVGFAVVFAIIGIWRFRTSAA
jgi:ABC-type multidrug transport system permease subunit